MWKQMLMAAVAIACTETAMAQVQISEEKVMQFEGKIPQQYADNSILIRTDNESNEIGIMCTRETSEGDDVKYKITDVLGKTLIDGEIAGCSENIHLTALPYGVYMLQVSHDDKVLARQRIIKQ